MLRKELEPGLAQVVRIYALLRVLTLLVMTVVSTRPHHRGLMDGEADSNVFLFLAGGEIFFMLGYALWKGLSDVLGRFYLPVMIVASSILLLLEQYLFPPGNLYGQSQPFLYVLLLIVAWQFRFSHVIFFTLGTALIEAFLILSFPAPMIPIFPEFRFDRAFSFGRVMSRFPVFIILGFIVTRLMNAQRQQRQALADANLKLIQHASTLEQLTISRERNRMARELHDTLAHTLSALSVQFEALSTLGKKIPKKAQDMIDQMRSTTRKGLEETRRSVIALRAPQLEELGLALAIRSLAEDLSARNSLSLELDIPEDIEELNHNVEQTFYRITQEALENIAKHAEAHAISIQLEYTNDQLKLTIQDDGQGFNPELVTNEDQFGLRGMQERAGMIGAQLDFESSPECGTTVNLTWDGNV